MGTKHDLKGDMVSTRLKKYILKLIKQSTLKIWTRNLSRSFYGQMLKNEKKKKKVSTFIY